MRSTRTSAWPEIYRRQHKTSESLEHLKIAQRLRPDLTHYLEMLLEHDDH